MYDLDRYPNINRIWAGLIVDSLVKRGIDNYFTSPGLRNAPILSSIQLNENAIAHSGIDERGMAYRALGYAKATGKPGVLVCTSGTALANYYPAVIEAFQTNTPLIVLSADRPQRLVEWGDNQSIKQPGIYSDFIKGSLNLNCPNTTTKPQEVLDKVSRLLNNTTPLGPIHINLPFEEPLDLTKDSTPEEYRSLANEARSSILFEQRINDFDLPSLDHNKRTLVVLGPIPEFEDKRPLKDLLSGLQLPCLLDIGSGLKFSSLNSERVLPSFEHPEVKKLLESNKPELIVHLGGRLVSKHYYSFLKENPQIDVLLVGNEGLYSHPAQSPTWELKTSLKSFCNKASELGYLADCTPFTFDCKSIVGRKEDIIENSPFSFPAISKRIVELLPTGTSLYLGNSTTIRSFDAFASTKTHDKEIKVLTHRGASGIEGFNAAALGYTEANKDTTVLVHGDISFMHDLSSLFMFSNKKIPLINIIINNKGGGIFKHLPISNDKETMPLITTEHEKTFKECCDWLKFDYTSVNNISQLESAFGNALKKQSICFIEAIIDQNENLAVYERLKTLKL